MVPLIDGDILLHELGWSGEFKDRETKKWVLLDFDHVAELLDKKIEVICHEVYAKLEPIIYITNSEWIYKNRKHLRNPVPEYSQVFRYKVATTKPYKGTRTNPKPFHFYNIIAYLDANYNVRFSKDGYEADDMIALDNEEYAIICSRDKDLRMLPGNHYSWECGDQRAIGPHTTDEYGSLEYVNGKLLGYGKKFFYYQLLTGDTVDNIPGLPGIGEKKAFKLLEGVDNEKDAFKTVKKAYIETVGKEKAKTYFLEQANLLWIGGSYEIPNY